MKQKHNNRVHKKTVFGFLVEKLILDYVGDGKRKCAKKAIF